MVSYSLYKLNRIGDQQHPCRTPLPVSTLRVSMWSSRTLSLWSMYSLLIIFFRASQYQFPLASALIWSILHGQVPSATLRSKHTIPHQCPVFFRYYSQHSNCIRSSFFSPKSKLIFSKYVLNFPFSRPSILATIFAVCAMRLIVRWSLHFVAFGFFFEAVTATWMKFFGHSPDSYKCRCTILEYEM